MTIQIIKLLKKVNNLIIKLMQKSKSKNIESFIIKLLRKVNNLIILETH